MLPTSGIAAGDPCRAPVELRIELLLTSSISRFGAIAVCTGTVWTISGMLRLRDIRIFGVDRSVHQYQDYLVVFNLKGTNICKNEL